MALDEDDRYAGIVLLAEAHADADDDHKVSDICCIMPTPCCCRR